MVLVGTAVAVAVARPGRATIFNPGAARLQRSAVCLLLGGQQQRQRLRWPGREHAVLQHRAGPGDALRPLLADRSRRWPSPARWRARRQCRPAPGTLPTHTPLFVGWLVGVVLLVGALTFVPALALGPIVEHLLMADGQLSAMTAQYEPMIRDTQTDVVSAASLYRRARLWTRSCKLDPRVAGAQPGHVRGRGRQRADHVLCGSRRCSGQGEAPAGFIWRRVAVAVVHRAVRQLRRGDGRGRGKAQAEALRKTRQETQAKKLREPRARRPASSWSRRPALRKDDLVLVEAGDIIPADGEVDRRRRLGGRERHHRRERAGHPRERRRPQRRHRRHARALRLAGGARHGQSRRELSRPHDRAGGRRQAAEDAQRDRAEHPAGRRSRSSSCSCASRCCPSRSTACRRPARARRSPSPCWWRCWSA